MESKGSRQGGDSDHALIGQTKDPARVGERVELASHPEKDLSKIKCFICHKNDHYASQCPEKKKGKGKHQHQVATSVETQMNEFASKFKKDFSMVSRLSSSTIPKNAWCVDSGASRHMTSPGNYFPV
jgi:hypothetical protein